MHEWLPKSVLALRDYSRQRFVADLLAGITVGLVALPLAMAFAIASGVPPQSGLYCAIVAGFLVSACGGSLTQIGGPTGAFVVVVYNIVAKHGIDGLFMCTLEAGVILVLLGITGLGSAVKFIPRPVVVGFTNGIAVIIASTQIKDFFGLKIEKVPGDFLDRMEVLGKNFRTLSVEETCIGLLALAIIIAFMRYVKRVPGYIVALVAGTAAVLLLHLDVQTIGTRFGGIPSGLPKLEIPQFHANLLRPLISPALTVAMLGAIESLMSAVVSDRLSGDKHNPNVELVGQGIANIFSPLFGGLPATGAIARTATNIRSGATSPVAGMIHSATLLAIVVFAAPAAKFIPLAVLSAILFVVAYNMGEWREIPQILKLSKLEIGTWLASFLLTVFADLTTAVEAGMIMAVLVFIRRVSLTTTVSMVTEEYVKAGHAHILQNKDIPGYVAIFRIHGPFLFGTTEKMEEITSRIDELPPVVIVRLRNMTAIDATGIQALETAIEAIRRTGRKVLLCGARRQPKELIEQSGLGAHVGEENMLNSISDALERAKALQTSVVHA
ncbi:sulphate transporter [Candidatus Koribacter versatilis Ellin345]|uniref:Sulphate transporter n=1 Tax=Koribacter versatilis (strain Ellin345) TaxID=204669 RepID=Q1IV72_KORVE|nr:SulP family inorganic anion transporter [Candidatus Koribacter versatilis]ABF39228.1 sulphate transporter [Candidatus Koribacter versatilis Ellin345]